MPRTLDPELRRALAERIRYYNEMGIYDFYRRAVDIARSPRVAGPWKSRSQPNREKR